MKKAYFSLLLFIILLTNGNAQTLYQNFNCGNREVVASSCWYTPGCSFVNTPSEVIEGAFSIRTGQLSGGAANPNGLISPWVKLNGNGVITFKHKLNTWNQGITRKIYVSIESATNQNIQDTLFKLDYNSATATTVKSTTVSIPSYTANKVYRIRIFAYGTGGNARCLMDDVSINGAYASCPANRCSPIISKPDADNDGVADVDDVFPNDFYRAHKIQYPFNTKGTLLYEDLWPANGDNDFNDLVVNYQYELVTNAANKLVEIKTTYVVKAIGGSLRNGFALQLDNISSNKIIQVIRNKPAGSLFTIAANGVEANQVFANIPIFSNAQSLLPSAGGIGANNNVLFPFVQPDTLQLTIVFLQNGQAAAGQQPLSIADINFGVFNPYIIVAEQRGKEIHGADKKPSSKASNLFFGTSNDRTAPALNRYYRNSNNLPWMLDVPIMIPHTQESKDILKAYPKLLQWAISNGVSYADWYRDIIGHRATENLYPR